MWCEGLPGRVGRECARELEPVFLGNIALADGDQAAGARLRVEQAISIFCATIHVDVKAMVHRLFDIIVKELVVTAIDKFCAARAQFRKSLAHHHESRRQPRAVDERNEVARALLRRRVVIVVEKPFV